MKNNLRSLAVAILLIFAIVAVGLIPSLDASTKANIWVATGTLGLALITWLSLKQTRAVIAAEDRRHQQGYAPLLLLTTTQLSNGRFNAAVDNAGQGLALKVLVLLDGQFSTAHLVNTGPNKALTPLPNLPLPEDSKAHHIGVIPVRGSAGISFPQERAEYSTVSLTRVRIEYADMFGNEYVTLYRTHSVNPNDFIWQQPKHLRIPDFR